MDTHNDDSVLRFEVHERVVLFPQNEQIQEILNLELIPEVHVRNEADEVAIKGYLLLQGEYLGRTFRPSLEEKIAFLDYDLGEREGGADSLQQPGTWASRGEAGANEGEIHTLLHRIPVEIRAPARRVPSLERVQTEVQGFDFEQISEHELEVVAEIVLSGLQVDAEPAPADKPSDFLGPAAAVEPVPSSEAIPSSEPQIAEVPTGEEERFSFEQFQVTSHLELPRDKESDAQSLADGQTEVVGKYLSAAEEPKVIPLLRKKTDEASVEGEVADSEVAENTEHLSADAAQMEPSELGQKQDLHVEAMQGEQQTEIGGVYEKEEAAEIAAEENAPVEPSENDAKVLEQNDSVAEEVQDAKVSISSKSSVHQEQISLSQFFSQMEGRNSQRDEVAQEESAQQEGVTEWVAGAIDSEVVTLNQHRGEGATAAELEGAETVGRTEAKAFAEEVIQGEPEETVLSGSGMAYWNRYLLKKEEGNRASLRLHCVQKGETLTAVAERYGVSLQDLLKRNRVADAAQLLDEGKVLRLP